MIRTNMQKQNLLSKTYKDIKPKLNRVGSEPKNSIGERLNSTQGMLNVSNYQDQLQSKFVKIIPLTTQKLAGSLKHIKPLGAQIELQTIGVPQRKQ